MLLWLMRHGIAAEPDEAISDDARPLTKEGIRRTRAAARGLAALGVRPQRICTSPLVRARMTAELAADAFGLDRSAISETEALRSEAPADLLFGMLAAAAFGDVLCCGHAPNLDFVLARALGAERAITALKKASCAALELGAPAPGRGRLLWLIPPDALRAI